MAIDMEAGQLVEDMLKVMTDCLADLKHYAATHGTGPDIRLEAYQEVLERAKEWEWVNTFEQHTTNLGYLSCGINGKCPECQSAYDMSEAVLSSAVERGAVSDEGGFSRSSCDGCGSSLAGHRYAAHAIIEGTDTSADGDLVHLNVCTDCLQYIANGTLPGEG